MQTLKGFLGGVTFTIIALLVYGAALEFGYIGHSKAPEFVKVQECINLGLDAIPVQ